jgi:hypothetical protein
MLEIHLESSLGPLPQIGSSANVLVMTHPPACFVSGFNRIDRTSRDGFLEAWLRFRT